MTSAVSYDIVHAHYGYSAYPAMFRLQAPLVITLHGSDVLGNILERLCTRAVSHFADAVIVVSERMRRRIPGIVIPCGVDLGVFKPYDRDEARARLRWPKDRHIVLFPFDPERRLKRYDLARASVERLVQEGVDAELMTVFNVANGEMPWCYSAADAMLLCSDREGSPTSVKEALACNLPVVATQVGDVAELLSGVAGTRICPQDVGAIARNLREVLDMSRRREFRGRAAMARYDQALTVERIVSVYTEVLSQPRKPQRQTVPPPSGSSRHQARLQPHAHADRWKEVGSSDAGPQPQPASKSASHLATHGGSAASPPPILICEAQNACALLDKKMKRAKSLFWFLAILFLPSMVAPTVAFGVTYFANPGDDISAKLSVLKPGDTLIFNDGTYYQLYIAHGTALKGTATAPITLKAANDGKAVFDSGGTAEPIFITGSSYVTLQGFVARNSNAQVVDILGADYGGQANDHITLQRITAYNSGDGNNHVFSVAGPQSNILIEDCAAWGRGRYKFIAYHSSYVTFRRDWAYWEGFTNFSPAPRAPFAVYGADHVTLENVIGTNSVPIQSDNNYYTAVFHTSDDTINHPSSNLVVLGSAFFNNCEGWWENNSAGSGTYMKDNFFSTPANSTCQQFISSFPLGDALAWPNANVGTITNATIVNSKVGLNNGVYGPSGGSPMVCNSVILGNTTAIVSDGGHSFVDFFGNGSNGTSLTTGDQAVSPGYDTNTYGMGAYLFVPPGSPLKGAGAGGADVGANIIYEYVNGRLTQTPLWPWPMEGRILAEKGISVTYASNGGFWNTLNGVYLTPAHKRNSRPAKH